MRDVRTLQLQVKMTPREKALYDDTAKRYNLATSTFARLAMEYVANNMPSLLSIDPMEAKDDAARLNIGSEVHSTPAAIFRERN